MKKSKTPAESALIPFAQLYNRCDPDSLGFASTSELEPLLNIVGQDRAIAAVHFGVGIKAHGYNLYVLGPPGIGKRSLLTNILNRESAEKEKPCDWCYVNNFQDATRPRALALPAGMGQLLKDNMRQLVEDLCSSLPTAFESEEFHARSTEIEESYKSRQEAALETLRKKGEEEGFTLVRTPMGMAFAPIRKGKVLQTEDFNKLKGEEQETIKASLHELQEKAEDLLRQAPRWRRETQKQLKDLDRATALFVLENLIEEIREKFTAVPEVGTYLDSVCNHVVDHLEPFLGEARQANPILPPREDQGRSRFLPYEVNLLVDHSNINGGPVVYEDNPIFPNLVGQVEHRSQMGALVTDFTLIKAGALHRANGGFLLLDAYKLLTLPYSWDGIKRALNSCEIRVESLGQSMGMISTLSLEPEPIPLDAKILLVGDRRLYYLLCSRDPDFAELFKVAADFEDRIPRDQDNTRLYANLIGTLAANEGLTPLDKAAVARVIEFASRLADDQEKISILMGQVCDLLREADYHAQLRKSDKVAVEDVCNAINQRQFRADRIYKRLLEAHQRGTYLVETQGERVASINGLAVIQLGNVAFGQPHRITTTARMGDGKVVDIEREVKLGGPTHSKGVLILSSFLAHRYAEERPLTFSGSIVFEQSYGQIDGDSASLAELCALLSAIGQFPLKQNLALTGSVNQQGQVQPIGGVNEKVEGFFDVCKIKGLTGDQGVIIPQSNIKNLMLRDDILAAVLAGQFHLYATSSLDQTLELLTGQVAGSRDSAGRWSPDSLNAKIQARLDHFTETRQAFNRKTTAKDRPSKKKGPEEHSLTD